jgi:hypothetical protein
MPQLSQSDPIELQDRLSDQDEIFTLPEVYQAVELLAPEMGFSRGEQLPKPGTVRLFMLTVPGFEFLGVLSVKLLTGHDQIKKLNLRDKLLDDNFDSRQNTNTYFEFIAEASLAIVSPPGLVDDVLNDTDPDMMNFFLAFYKEYRALVAQNAENIRKKKYLEMKAKAASSPDGSASASTSETVETSSPPTQDGSE